jgi:hypothetical protein
MGNSDPGSLSDLCGLPRVMVGQAVTVPQTKPVCGRRQGDRMKRRDATPRQASSSLGASLYLRLALHIVWGAAMKWFSKARQTCFNQEDQPPPSPPPQTKVSTNPCALVSVPQIHGCWQATACPKAAYKTATSAATTAPTFLRRFLPRWATSTVTLPDWAEPSLTAGVCATIAA